MLPPDTAQVVTTGPTTDVTDALALSPSRETEDSSSASLSKKRRKSTKGWDGEELPASAVALRTAQINDTNGAHVASPPSPAASVVPQRSREPCAHLHPPMLSRGRGRHPPARSSSPHGPLARVLTPVLAAAVLAPAANAGGLTSARFLRSCHCSRSLAARVVEMP